MCQKLSEYIYHGTPVWMDFIQLLKSRLTYKEIGDFENKNDGRCSDICDKLKEKGFINIGKYDSLVE